MTGRRIIVRGLRDIAMEDFSLPDDLGPEQMILETHWSLISPGTEAFCARQASDASPVYPGYTSAGRIVAAGEAKKDHLGSQVFVFPEMEYSHGAHATHKLISGDCLVREIDSDLAMEEALFARMINIALTPFVHSRHDGGVVVVFGLGLVGNMICQVGRLLGFVTVGCDPIKQRREKALECGCLLACPPDEVGKGVEEASRGRGACLVADTVVTDQTMSRSLELLHIGGDYSMVGVVKGGAAEQFQTIWNKDIQVNSGWEMRLQRKSAGAPSPTTETNLERAFCWLNSGAIRVKPVLTDRITPEGFSGSFQALTDEPAEHLGVVVDWRGEV